METKHDILRYGKIVQKRRQDIGLTQEELAEAIGLSQGFVNKLERGAADVTAMKLRNFTSLLEQLNWSAGEFSEATGIEIAPVLRNSGGRVGKKGQAQAVVDVMVYAVPDTGPSVEGAAALGRSLLHSGAYHSGIELYICPDDSMATGDPATLHAGDILHVHTAERTLAEGKLYLLRADKGRYYVRRVRTIDKSLWFLSDDPKQPPIKTADAEVIGQITSWARIYNA